MEENRSTITYDENWQDVTEPEYPVILEPSENDDGEDEELPKRMPRKRTAPKQLLLTMQLIACILLILAAFAIKGIGGELYQTAREWYYTHLNRYHERLTDVAVVPREKPHTGAAAREQPRASPVIAT